MLRSAFVALVMISVRSAKSVNGMSIPNCTCVGCVPLTTFIQVDCSGRPDNDSDLLLAQIDSLLSNRVTEGRLMSLSITHTSLTQIPRSICRLTSLTQLHVRYNRLTSLPDNCLTNLTALSTLTADCNNITQLQDGLFDGLSRLQRLNLNHNQISSIGLEVFNSSAALTSLTDVHLRENRLTTLEPWPYFIGVNSYGSNQRSNVDLHGNRISAFTNRMGLKFSCSMKRMSLNLVFGFNKIRHLSDSIKGWNVSLTTIWCLSGYGIRRRHGRPSSKVILDGTYLDCDCIDFKLYVLMLASERSAIPFGIYCNKPDSLHRRRLASITLDQFVCELTDHCPPGCRCVHRPANSTLHVYCSNANLTALPLELPALPKSYTRYKLDFSNNRLLHRLEHRDYFVNASILDVSSCGVHTVDDWKDVFHLKHVYLHGNRLTSLPPYVASLQLSTRNLSLYNNPWTCSCKNKWMAKWLKSVSQHLLDYQYISCASPSRLRGMSLLQISDEEFCVDPTQKALAIAMSSVVGALAALCSVCVLIYRLRFRMYARWKFHPFDRDECLGEDVDFDVFISSSSDDNLPHGNRIRVKLEENGYRVCYPPRDFMPGRLILDNIYDAIVRSKRTVCLLTTSFLERLDQLLVFMT